MRPALSAIPQRSRLYLLALEVAVFCLIWSSAFSISKVALLDCPPLLLLTARFLLAAAVLLGGAFITGARWRLDRRDLMALALVGVANNALYLGFNYLGMGSVSSGLTALISSMNPVLMAVLAAFFLGEPMTWRKAGGLVLGVLGIALIVRSRVGSGAESATGVALVVAGLMSLVAGAILFKRLAPKGGLWIANGIQNLAGALALAPVALTTESIGGISPSWRLLAALLYLAMVGSVVAYLLWLHLLTVLGATAASAYHFLMPPLGLLFGWLVLGEHMAPHELVGIVPVALGIYLVTHPAAARRTAIA
jgi:drug/metabolite transporter (DMT)-like permease